MRIKKLFIILFCLIAYAQIQDRTVFAFLFYFGDVGPPGENEVHIAKSTLVMPIGRIMLVRKNHDYCAIKFTKWWSENPSSKTSIFVATGTDEYAVYEGCYQNDKSSDKTDKSWQIKKARLSLPKGRGIGTLTFSFADRDIECGKISVSWAGQGAVCFNEACRNHGDDGFEFAPTPWSDIKEVDFFDPRIKWFRFDDSRKRVNIPIDKLWEK